MNYHIGENELIGVIRQLETKEEVKTFIFNMLNNRQFMFSDIVKTTFDLLLYNVNGYSRKLIERENFDMSYILTFELDDQLNIKRNELWTEVFGLFEIDSIIKLIAMNIKEPSDEFIEETLKSIEHYIESIEWLIISSLSNVISPKKMSVEMFLKRNKISFNLKECTC